MSASSKYCEAEITERRLEQLRKERARLAGAEERARRDREKLHQRRQAEEARSAVADLVEQAKAALQAHRKAPYSSFAKERWPSLAHRVDEQEKAARASDDPKALARSDTALRDLLREIGAAAATARAKLAETQAQLGVERRVSRLSAILDCVSPELTTKFDPARRGEAIRRELSKARDVNATERWEMILQQAESDVQAYVGSIEAAHTAWLAERSSAKEALDQISLRLAGLHGDEIVNTWCAPVLAQAESQARDLADSFRHERWAEVAGGAARISTVLDSALREAQDRQQQEEKRAYVVTSIMSVLEAQGFNVVGANLAQAGDYASDVIISARRVDRRAIDVEVPVSGPVKYTVDGYGARKEIDASGVQASSCDEAQEALGKIHDELARQFDVNMGELLWEGKPSERRSGDAEQLPSPQAPAGRKR